MGDQRVEQSPAGWVAPPGTFPAWNWIPEDQGLCPRLDRVPGWVRLWYSLPFVDRYAYAWMWHHGGWDITSDLTPDPGGSAGAREPLRPAPIRPATAHQRDAGED